ncbi:MAG: hypothetical protein MUF49_26490 [Oculatellaceae cyanobacterium Prado106]|jgi:hypothetical protein|nr:hypothetical protein [Oculatellaceae cyanobacterium Prado106]
MEFWEFLLQQEGDRSWLSVESASVEILEGRYRIMARASRVNTPVDIRVTHDATHEDPPIRRTQKRTVKTNPEGLVVIMPFTRLLPGIWELRCSGDVMADLLGEGWSKAVKLQVLPLELDTDWHDDQPDAGETVPLEYEAYGAATPLAEQHLTEVGLTDYLPEEPALPAEPAFPPAIPTVVPAIPTEPETVTYGSIESSESLESSEQFDLANSPAIDAAIDNTTAMDVQGIHNSDIHNSDIDSQAVDSYVLDVQAFEPSIAPPALDAPALEIPDQPVNAPDSSISSESESESSSDLYSPSAIAAPTSQPLGIAETSAASQAPASSLQIQLDQDTWEITAAMPLILSGHIVPQQDIAIEPSNLSLSHLRVRLFDPQTAKMLVDQSYPLKVDQLPTTFTCALTVPEDQQTHLLLGEIALYGLAQPGALPPVMATESFNVTTRFQELLDAIAKCAEVDEQENNPAPAHIPTPAPTAPSLDLTFFNLPPLSQTLLEFQSSETASNPLQPTSGTTDSPKARPLDLPSFVIKVSKPQSTPLQEAVSEPSKPEVSEESLTNAEAHEPMTVPDRDPLLEAIATTPTEPSPIESTPAAPDSHPPDLNPQSPEALVDDWDEDWEIAQDGTLHWRQQIHYSTTQSPEAPEDQAFRSLNLQDRFWNRLQSMATDNELSEEMRSPSSRPSRDWLAVGLENGLAADEIVVEDEGFEDFSPIPLPATPATAYPSPPGLSGADPWARHETPVPLPEILLPAGELVADRPIEVLVKLPSAQPRIYAKLWVIDRQTRLLLDGPRWLMDLQPDGLGHWVARTRVTLPPGSIDVQFEAIAIEMTTQRESEKVMVMRSILPPEFSYASYDEFEI